MSCGPCTKSQHTKRQRQKRQERKSDNGKGDLGRGVGAGVGGWECGGGGIIKVSIMPWAEVQSVGRISNGGCSYRHDSYLPIFNTTYDITVLDSF